MLDPFEPSYLTLRLNDRAPGIAQIGRVTSLSYSQAGASAAWIGVEVNLYAEDDLTTPLTERGFSAYRRELVADNNTAVDATSGAIVLVRSFDVVQNADGSPRLSPHPTEEDQAVFAERCRQHPDQLELQGNAFEKMRDKLLPMTLGQLMLYHLQQANLMGRFA